MATSVFVRTATCSFSASTMKKSRDDDEEEEEEEDRQAFFAVIPLVTTAVHRPRSCEHAPTAVAAAMQDNMDGAGRREAH